MLTKRKQYGNLPPDELAQLDEPQSEDGLNPFTVNAALASNTALREKLYSGLREKAQANMQKQRGLMDTNVVTKEDTDRNFSAARDRNFAAGMQSAANKIGSFNGKYADNKDLEDNFDQANKIDAGEIAAKQLRFDYANKGYSAAESADFDAQTRPMELSQKEGTLKQQEQAQRINEQTFASNALSFKNEQALNDMNSPESVNLRDVYRKQFKKEPPATATGKQLAALIPMAERIQAREDSMKERTQARQDTLADRALGRENSLAERNLRRDELNVQRGVMSVEKKAVADEKKQEKDAEIGVEGFELDPTGKVRPQKTEVVKARTAQAALIDIRTQTKRMKELVATDGTNIMFGANSAEAKSLATQMRLNYKTVKELGALTGPDMALLEDVIANPGDWSSLLGSEKSAQKKLDVMLNGIQGEFDNKMKSLGYKKAGEPSRPSQPSQPKVGQEDGGHRFKGGDPANPGNWEKM